MIDRKSKLLKKAKSGMVMTEEQYASCRELSVHGDPTVSIIKDSRSSRSYDTSSNEIRNFVRSLSNDTAPPKKFAVKNKAFIRHVLIINMSSCNDLNMLQEIPLSSNQQWCEAKVRISRNVTDMSHGQCSMARNILSMSAEGMDDQDHLQQPPLHVIRKSPSDCAQTPAMTSPPIRHALEQYILSERQMRSMNYPLFPLEKDLMKVTALEAEPQQTAKQLKLTVTDSTETPVSNIAIPNGTSVDCDAAANCSDIASNMNTPQVSLLLKNGSKVTYSKRRRSDVELFKSKWEDRPTVSTSSPLGWPTPQHAEQILAFFEPTYIQSLSSIRSQKTTNSASIPKSAKCYETVNHEECCPGNSSMRVEECLWPVKYVPSPEDGAVPGKRKLLPRFADPSTCCPHIPVATSSMDSITVHTAGPSRYHVFGLDCEMCNTAMGAEVCRVTVVDEHCAIVLDTFVQPSSPVTDYLTEYSGVTAKDLEGVTTTLPQLQVVLLRLFHKERSILVGHSLENDLYALGVIHQKCVDTAFIYPHARGFPFRNRLKILAYDYLKFQIQQGEGKMLSKDATGAANAGSTVVGHCSADDARAALRLAVLKAEKGPAFGVGVNSGGVDATEEMEPRVPSVAVAYERQLLLCAVSAPQSTSNTFTTPVCMSMFFTDAERHRSLKSCMLPTTCVCPDAGQTCNDGTPLLSSTLRGHLLRSKLLTSFRKVKSSKALPFSPKHISIVDYVSTGRETTLNWLKEVLSIYQKTASPSGGSGAPVEEGRDCEARDEKRQRITEHQAGGSEDGVTTAPPRINKHTLVIVTLEQSTHSLRSLHKLKVICENNSIRSGQGHANTPSAVWSADDEKEYMDLCNTCNTGHIGMVMV